VRELLGRCLTRDAKDRLRDIGEARFALASPYAGSAGVATTAGGRPVRRGVPLGVAAVAALAIAALAVTVALLAGLRSTPVPVRRLDLVADGIEVDWFFTPQLSPDGRRIA